MRLDGTYDSWHAQFDTTNFNAYITDVTKEYNDWLVSRNSQSFVTEAGQVEEWKGGESSEELKKQFDKSVTQAMEIRNAKVD